MVAFVGELAVTVKGLARRTATIVVSNYVLECYTLKWNTFQDKHYTLQSAVSRRSPAGGNAIINDRLALSLTWFADLSLLNCRCLLTLLGLFNRLLA